MGLKNGATDLVFFFFLKKKTKNPSEQRICTLSGCPGSPGRDVYLAQKRSSCPYPWLTAANSDACDVPYLVTTVGQSQVNPFKTRSVRYPVLSVPVRRSPVMTFLLTLSTVRHPFDVSPLQYTYRTLILAMASDFWRIMVAQ